MSGPLLKRDAVLAEARRWIGTPWRHRASLRGIGCDCAGLVRGVWRELLGPEPDAVPLYGPDASGADLMAGARCWLEEIDPAAARPGDVLLFRPDPRGPARHCAILMPHARILHAWARRAVCETALTPWWRRRIAAGFHFPGVI